MAVHGAPYTQVAAKRSYDAVPIPFDWHDFLANQRVAGAYYPLGYTFRPFRAEATGLQYTCIQAGVTDGQVASLNLEIANGSKIYDGQVVWQAEPLDATSMRATIQSYQYVTDTGVTAVDDGVNDYVYTAVVSGGVSGTSYQIKHQVTLSDPPEQKEAVAVLPVSD